MQMCWMSQANQRTTNVSRLTNKKVEICGLNPEESTNTHRASLQTGFHISFAGKHTLRDLRMLRSCFMLIGSDHLKFACLGTVMPSCAKFDNIRQGCSIPKTNQKVDDLSGTESSSSTSDGNEP